MNKSDRNALALRRRRLLTRNTREERSCFQPMATLGSADPDLSGSASVAVVSSRIPNPDAYDFASRHDAELLSALVNSGVCPVFLYLGSAKKSRLAQAALKHYWPRDVVRYQFVPLPKVPPVRGLLATTVHEAYRLYEWLKHCDFDVVHGGEGAQGVLYYCLRAREQGIAFPMTRFVIHHSEGILDQCLTEYKTFSDISMLSHVYLAHTCLALADLLPLSGKDAVNRLLDKGVSLTPGQIHYSPLRFDRSAAAVAFECNLNSKKPNSFKRVLCLPGSSRRGISLFCTALKRQFSAGDGLIPVEFAVPEKCGKNLRSYVKKLSSGMKESFVVHIVKDRLALVSLLAKEPETLCVLPVVDGSNRYQLRDLVVAGAELLVADQNTAAEILDETVLPALTCDPLPDAIAECMKARLQSNQKILPVAVPEIPVPGLWIQPATKLSSFSLSTDPPLVTICLMHFERPGLIEQALASILEQTYTALEVVLVDDGSFKPETRQKLNELEERFQDLGWRIIRQANLYLGAARNTAAIAAKGQYLYFLDDDNVLNPHALETLVKVAEKTGADVVTAFADEFSENRPPGSDASASRRIVQIGDDVAYGLFRNGFGDSNALVRRSAFMALGGNTEDYGVGLDDHEFFARAVLNGYQLTIVPEALYWARQMPTRLRNRHFNANAGHVRVLRAFLPHVPPKLHAILFLAIGQEQAFFEGSVFRDWLRGRIRQLANTRLGVWLRFIIFEPVMRWTRLRRGETE